MRHEFKDLRKAEVQTVVECPYCNESFKVKTEAATSVKSCVFCRREFVVIDREPTHERKAA